MKVLVFGAGAIGGVLGALLSRKQDVHLVARGEHLETITREGLTIDGLIRENFRIKASDSSSLKGRYDLILVTTKAYDTEVAIVACKDLLERKGVVLTVQNGIGNAEKLSSVFGREKVVAGVTTMAAHRLRPGAVEYVAEGEIVIGTLAGNDGAVSIMEKTLGKAGVGTRRTDNILGAIWSKAIVNAAINPLTAIFGCRNGMIAEKPALAAQALKVCEEGEKVASAMQIKLDPPGIYDYALEVARRTSGNKSSMLMDIGLRRRTEIDAICGSIIGAGKAKGVDTPAISRLYTIVKFLESRDSMLQKLNMQT